MSEKAPSIPLKAPAPERPPALWLPAAAIALAGIAVYHNSFAVPFFFDDRAQITDNPTIKHLWALRSVLTPPVKAGVGGRPLLNLSFAINYALGGMNVWGYHAYNLALHILSGLTLFGIVRRTLKGRGMGFQPMHSFVRGPEAHEPMRHGREAHATAAALAVALIWVVHPLQTEAVTYIAERAESQMGLFYFATLYCFIRWVAPSEALKGAKEGLASGADEASSWAEPSRSRPRWAWLSVLACLLGICTKEVVVTAPLIVLLYDRTFVSGTFRAAWRRHWRVYAGYAATWLLLAYLLANLGQRGVGFGVGGSWWDYALTESRVVPRYFLLAVWPHPQIFDYGSGVKHPGWETLPWVVGVLALVAGTVFLMVEKPPECSPRRRGDRGGITQFFLRVLRASAVNPVCRPLPNFPTFLFKYGRALGFAGAWVFIILAPTSSVMAVAGQPMAEHRMYLPLAAIITVAVGGVFALAGARAAGEPAAASARPPTGGVILLAMVVIVLGGLTLRRNEAYRTEVSIWSDTVAKRPGNERAQNGLGLALVDAGRPAEAIGRYREAIRLAPDYPEAHQNLAAALELVGQNGAAVAECREALRLRPANPEYLFNLGVALQLSGRTPEAIDRFDQALRLRPDYPEAENNLGLALVSAGRFSAAAGHFAQAARLQPGNAEVRLNLGSALYDSGDTAGAVREMTEAVRLSPGWADGHYSLAVALHRQGREQESTDEFAEARRLGRSR